MSSSADIDFENAGWLKLDLMLKGVRVSKEVFDKGLLLTKYKVGPHEFGKADLEITPGLLAAVSYQEAAAQQSPYELIFENQQLYLQQGLNRRPIKIIPPPGCYTQTLHHRDVPLGELVSCHGHYAALALGGHRYLLPSLFRPDEVELAKAHELTVDETLWVIKTLKKETPIDIVTFSAWETDGEDGGIEQIEPYIRGIKKTYNLLTVVEVHLPHTTEWIEKSYAMGADAICYHLGDICRQVPSGTVNTHRDGEKEKQLLQHAVGIFPTGTVQAHVTIGPHPTEEILQELDALIDLGVLPIITVDDHDQALKNSLDSRKLAMIFDHVYQRSVSRGIAHNWLQGLSPFFMPLEGRFFGHESSKMKMAISRIYQMRFFGSRLSSFISNLRRSLRVKKIDDDGRD